MDNRWSQIVACVILGYAGMFLGMFIFDFLDGIAHYFPGHRNQTSFMLILSIGVYLAWIFGVSTSGFDKLHYFARGLFATFFLNFGIIWALKYRLHIKKISFETLPEIVIFMVVLNILVAAYSGKNFEDKLKDFKTGEESFHSLMPYAIVYPLGMIAVFWVIMYTVKAAYGQI
ncbi:MAG: hypothetical protein K8I00_11380 [Candidatus Omnitrophica bacterium]|nr:hypothetical protein [Candidatus Omnitrophota bacterium]